MNFPKVYHCIAACILSFFILAGCATAPSDQNVVQDLVSRALPPNDATARFVAPGRLQNMRGWPTAMARLLLGATEGPPRRGALALTDRHLYFLSWRNERYTPEIRIPISEILKLNLDSNIVAMYGTWLEVETNDPPYRRLEGPDETGLFRVDVVYPDGMITNRDRTRALCEAIAQRVRQDPARRTPTQISCE